jgi:uracil-DNA glycosylase family 4
MSQFGSLGAVANAVIHCRVCPRLVAWREQVAREKKREFREWTYWGKPVPGFGDPNARLVIVGLAPAAHGANRTGRMFTGDSSGDWLYEALHRFGFATSPTSRDVADGLALRDCYITASARCAPPGNRPTLEELHRCRPFLEAELGLLGRARVVLALGLVAHNAWLRASGWWQRLAPKERPPFAHGAEWMAPLRGNGGLKPPLGRADEPAHNPLHAGEPSRGSIPRNRDGADTPSPAEPAARVTLIASYHPSRQNTNTGKLTRAMWNGVFERVREIVRRET